MQGAAEKEVVAEGGSQSTQRITWTQVEPSCLKVRRFTGQWSRNSGSMAESARTKMSGQKKSEPFVKSAMMTRWTHQRCRLRGFVTREVGEIAWSLSRAQEDGSADVGRKLVDHNWTTVN